MQKFSIIALAASLAIGLTLPTYAAATTAPPTIPDPGPGCKSDCEPAEPGEPFIPDVPKPECKINCTPGGDPDDPPGEPGGNPQDQAQLKVCEDKLSGLGDVSAQQIASLSSPARVKLFPICEVKSLTGVKPLLIEKGNADGLEAVIKANELISAKLKATAYKSQDVIGIEFDADGNAVLYMHRRS